MKVFKSLVALCLLFSLQLTYANSDVMSKEQVSNLLKELDEKTRFDGDYKAIVLAHSKNRETGENIQQMAVYRRDEDERMMLLFLKPKADAGKGYLMIDKNFFSYEPSTGGWNRVSDERIGGSALNRGNFNGFNFEERYNGEFVAHEKLGKFSVVHIKITANEDVKSEEKVIELWLDAKNHNVLKQQDYARSGRLLRTSYRTNYKRFADDNGEERFVPLKTIVVDEVEKGNQTTMVIKQIDMKPLSANIFTKAWLESKSR